MKLYLMRHGQSTANLERNHAGWAQVVPLTDKGILDAKHLGTLIKDIPFDKLYSSDLLRAIQTGEYALPGVEKEQTPLLRELDVGSIAGIPIEECRSTLGDAYKNAIATRNLRVFGGESTEEQIERLRQFLSMIEKSDYSRVGAFCHEGVQQCMLAIATGTVDAARKASADNGSVAVFEYANGVWKLLIWNYTGALQ